MAIIRWSPVSEVTSLTNAINRLFADSFAPDQDWAGLPGARQLPINMKETKDAIVVETAIPGVPVEDVEIHVTDNVLTIKGEMKKEDEKNDDDYVCKECYEGSFFRQVSLPTSVAADKAEASADKGMLTVIIPKTPEAQPKRIEIKSK